MPSARFKPAIPVIQWLQTYALNRTSSWFGEHLTTLPLFETHAFIRDGFFFVSGSPVGVQRGDIWCLQHKKFPTYICSATWTHYCLFSDPPYDFNGKLLQARGYLHLSPSALPWARTCELPLLQEESRSHFLTTFPSSKLVTLPLSFICLLLCIERRTAWPGRLYIVHYRPHKSAWLCEVWVSHDCNYRGHLRLECDAV